jgi:hypothetical protein
MSGRKVFVEVPFEHELIMLEMMKAAPKQMFGLG